MATDALVADIARDASSPDLVTLWITESTVGGAGVLQALSERYAREPRSLFRAIEAALEPSDLESASVALVQTYKLMATNNEVSRAVEEVRGEVSHEARAQKREVLLQALDHEGLDVTRTFVVSLNARVLAPGARRAHDDVVRAMLKLWDEVEAAVGLELDAREIAELGALDEGIAALGIAAGLFDSTTPAGERTAAISGLLWPKADALRRDALAGWSVFRKPVTPVPQLARAVLLEPHTSSVSLEQDDWKTTFAEELALGGAARIHVTQAKRKLLRAAVVELQATQIDVGHLQLYPVLERISKEGQILTAHFVLREQV
jgi:hypothetical protein